MKIDAHHHFWDPARGDYGWMPPDDPVLTRPYGPADLAPHLAGAGITGTVLVQAAPTLAETDYLLRLAEATPWVKGVVGWINFEDPGDLAPLRRLAAHPKFVGLRPMIQDIPEPDWMLRDDVQWAFRAITDLDLTFDALGFPQHIPYFSQLTARYPQLRVVFDHCLKPRIRDQQAGRDAFAGWADGMAHLAAQSTGYCKLSGLVTEADVGWTRDDLRPFVDHVIGAFGAHRVMWGSDWPVSRLQSDYATWHDTARDLTRHLQQAERDAIFGGTASRFYRLG